MRLFALTLEAVLKLAPDPAAAPVANGETNVETPEAGVEENNDPVPAIEGVADMVPKSDDCGEAPKMVGVENREEDAAGVAKRENPLPDEADEAGAARDAVDAPGIAELAKSPAT